MAPTNGSVIVPLLSKYGHPLLRSAANALARCISADGLTDDIHLPAVDEAVVGVLCGLFKEAMIESLAYTEDDCEIPSLATLTGLSGSAFPVEYLDDKTTALCLFCSALRGRNDVIRVYNAGIKAVTLVDIDPISMADMTKIYPTHWKYVILDYRNFISDALDKNLSFDAVVADEPHFLFHKFAWDNFSDLKILFNDVLIVNYGRDMLEALGWDGSDVNALSERLSQKLGCDARVLKVSARSKDVAWMVFGK